jgi:hypothetical protein
LEEFFAFCLGHEIVDYGGEVVLECGDWRGCLCEVDIVNSRVFWGSPKEIIPYIEWPHIEVFLELSDLSWRVPRWVAGVKSIYLVLFSSDEAQPPTAGLSHLDDLRLCRLLPVWETHMRKCGER